MLVMVNVAAPVLVSVTVFTALVVPTGWLIKFSGVGLSATPTPLTLNDCCTCGAALKLALPGWLALMVQVPVVTKPSKPVLVTVQTLVVAEVKTGVKPDVAVAVSVGVVPNTWLPGLAKLMVWLAGLTLNDC